MDKTIEICKISVFNLLDQEDSHRVVHSQTSSSLETPSAFQVSQPSAHSDQYVNRPPQPSSGYQRKDRPFYTFCHCHGHVIDRCYKKHGYPNSMKPSPKSDQMVSSMSANVGVIDTSQHDDHSVDDLSPTQIQQLVSFLSTKLQTPTVTPTPEVHLVSASTPSSSTTCLISGTFHPSILCSFTGIDRPYVCSLTNNANALNAWVIDSEATNHISHQRSSFISFKSLPDTTVSLPNGVLVSIVGISTIALGRNLILSDVLYIPQFKFNLLSVSCLTKGLHCRVWFDESSCGIQDRTWELMIGMGREVANLYFLDIESLSSSGTLQNITVAAVSSVALWHKRLGHPSLSKLESIQSILDFPKQPNKSDTHCKVCHIYQNKKHHPFIYLTKTKTTSVFHERTKNLEMDCHRVRDRLVQGLFTLLHVRTELQLADPFTNPLYPAPFKKLFGKMGLLNIFVTS